MEDTEVPFDVDEGMPVSRSVLPTPAEVPVHLLGDEYEAAKRYGFYLKRCGEYHYQLWGPNRSWLINLYPTTGRLYSDPHKPGPYLAIKGRGWTLLQVVEKAAEVTGQKQPTNEAEKY